MLTIFLGIVSIAWLSYGLPQVDEDKIFLTQSTQILDQQSNVLYTIHGEQNRQVVPLNKISKHAIDATLSVEDKSFYEHHGFYLKRIVGAVVNNLQGKPVQGASTITQQLVKNLFLTPQRSYKRKMQELILSIKIENEFSKDKILEMYLNAIPYGNNAYGIQQAARTYFDKDAADLDIAESAVLAALPKAPSRYNPYGTHRYSYLIKELTTEEFSDRGIESENDLHTSEFSRGLLGKLIVLDGNQKVYLRGRGDIVLESMQQDGFISEEQREEAWQKLQTIEFKKYREQITAPHFVFYIREFLETKYGKEMIEQGGLKVYTTLDQKHQEAAEKAIAGNAERNKTDFGAENAAMVTIDSHTGHILAMVGSVDYWNEEIDGNVNVVTRERQPGSSFKPFIYAKLFTAAPYGPGTPLYDIPLRLGNERPQNYDGTFRGTVTARRALGMSLNIPAIETYFLAGEEKEIVPFVNKFGIKIKSGHEYGWPLALGTAEVKLIEMTAGFGVFANGGKLYPTTGILKITNAQGNILEEWKTPKQEPLIIDPQIAFLINNILSDPTHNLGPRVRIPGYIVAAKTGTSSKKDPSDPSGEKILPSNNLTFMYTTDIVTGVWVGNTDGKALKPLADGYSTSSPIATDFLKTVLEGKETKPFEKPEKVEKITISLANSKLPGPLTPEDMLSTDFIASFSKPTEIDHDFQEATIDTLSGELATEFCPPERKKTKKFRIYHSPDAKKFPWWESAMKAWGETQPDKLPTKDCPLHSQETIASQPSITITEPQSMGSIETGKINVRVRVNAPNKVDKVEFYLNDNLQYTAPGPPYNGALRLSKATKPGSKHKITVKVIDSLGYVGTSAIEVSVGEPALSEAENGQPEPEEQTTTEEHPALKETQDESEDKQKPDS